MALTHSVFRSIQSPILVAAICVLLSASTTGFAQSNLADASAAKATKTEVDQNWKAAKIAKLEKQLVASHHGQTADAAELGARLRWLSEWNPGGMNSVPANADKNVPGKRSEPKLESFISIRVQAAISSLDPATSNKKAYQLLKNAACFNPCDIAAQQVYLHWMDDDPARRKVHLVEIEAVSRVLIGLLERSVICGADPQCKIALEFARYRRARALAYRELPDVIVKFPTQHPNKVSQQIKAAFDDLIREAGSGRTEFVLLEIRMLRRAGQRGRALQLLEKFGSTVLPKWYQKKRRDLLGELDWDPPFREAAAIFAKNFPAEVAKEQKRAAIPVGSN